jgi:hypothetical protein
VEIKGVDFGVDDPAAVGFVGQLYGLRDSRRHLRPGGSRAERFRGVATQAANHFGVSVRDGLLRLFRSSSTEWWPGAFSAASVMGWIFNAFGLALEFFSFQTQRASGFFMAGIGFWLLAFTILAFFSFGPQPDRRHRR